MLSTAIKLYSHMWLLHAYLTDRWSAAFCHLPLLSCLFCSTFLPILLPAPHLLHSSLQIVISWFLSPIAAAVVCLIIFLLVRTLVLRRANCTKVAFYVLPVLIIVTIWVVSISSHSWFICAVNAVYTCPDD
jgi:hypothetical protein